MDKVEYILGHDEHEVRRLELQARLFEPATEGLLRSIGLRPGLRVLDVGTGPGDVAMLASRMIGDDAEIIGIDREPTVVERARLRAAEAGQENVRFETATLETLEADEPFDIVVGRYVLMHQADPSALLRQAARLIRPGGRLAFIEAGIHGDEAWSQPAVPLFDRLLGLIKPALDAVGSNVGIGTDLGPVFAGAGLPLPNLACDIPVGDAHSPIVEWACHSARSLMPQLEAIGAVDAGEFDFATLEERLRAEVGSRQAQVRCYNLISGWVTIG